MQELNSGVALSPAQVVVIQPLVRRHAEELVTFHRELLGQLRATFETSDREIDALLDDHQKALFARMRAKRPALPGAPATPPASPRGPDRTDVP